MPAAVDIPFAPHEVDAHVGGLLSSSLSRLNSIDAFDVHVEVRPLGVVPRDSRGIASKASHPDAGLLRLYSSDALRTRDDSAVPNRFLPPTIAVGYFNAFLS